MSVVRLSRIKSLLHNFSLNEFSTSHWRDMMKEQQELFSYYREIQGGYKKKEDVYYAVKRGIFFVIKTR